MSVLIWENLNGRGASFGLRRLKEHRQVAEPPIVDDAAEWLEPEAALADVFVTIDTAAERLLGIVQVQHLEAIESDQAPELFERRRVAFRRAEVVPGREQMAGIEAHADAAMIAHLGDDRCELLERRSQRCALAGGVFEQHHRAAAPPFLKELDEAPGNERETVGFAAGRVAARVQHDAEQPQRLGAIELVAHRLHRLVTQGAVPGGEVDEITRVRDDRPESGRTNAAAKLADLGRQQRPPAPLVRVLGEDLERFAAMRDGALHGPRQTAGHRHVSTEPGHSTRIICRAAAR